MTGATSNKALLGHERYRDLVERGVVISGALTLPLIARLIRNLIAVTFWAGLFTHVFVHDLIVAANSLAPQIEPLIRYQFSLLFGFLALTVFMFRGRYLLLFFGYIAVFPVALLIWDLPRAVSHKWLIQ
jgi:hypothetical protein